MRILFFTRLFYPHIGGVEKHVFEVGQRLVKKGHQVTVITEAISEYYDDTYYHSRESRGIEVVRIPVTKNERLKKFVVWFELFKKINLIFKSDIIHCHDIFFWYLPFRFLFPFKKVYTTFHGYEGNRIPGKKAILMHKTAEVLSRGNICVGNYFNKWYGTKPTYVTYGAVGFSKIRNPNIEIRNNIKYQKSQLKMVIKNKWRILFIGRLEEETGIMEYLKALKILENRGYNAQLLVLGDGVQRKEAEKYSLLNKLRVDYKGFIKSEKINEEIIKADFIFTSRYLGILESLAAKKYVFAIYNNSIKKDYLWDSPFAKYISISKNDSSLVSEIVHMINNPKLISEKTEKGFDWVKNQSWEKMLGTYLDLWRLK